MVTEKGKLLKRLQCGINPIKSTEKHTSITGKDSLLLGYEVASMGNQISTFQVTVVSLPSRVKLFILQVIENHGNMSTFSATHTYHELMEKINIVNAMEWGSKGQYVVSGAHTPLVCLCH